MKPAPLPAQDNLIADVELSERERRVVGVISSQERLAEAMRGGSAVQIRASGDSRQGSLFATAPTIEVNSADAEQALRSVSALSPGLGVILVHDALQHLVETRQFLGACFDRLAVGGVLIVTAPHQFLYERKLRLPSRRNPSHRRFYTPNTLLADIEEAIDPCAHRVRFLADCDEGYDYRAPLAGEPRGGQDIVVAIEKIAVPEWRGALERDELWAQTPTRPVRFLDVDRKAPPMVRAIVPDRAVIGKIVVLKLDHRGDYLMAAEAFQILRSAFPGAELTLACGTWNAGEAEKSGRFDCVLPFDFYPEDDSARPETPPRDVLVKSFASLMRGRSYDLAVDLRLYDDSRELLRVIRARNRAGFDRYDAFPWLTIRMNALSATDDDRAEAGFFAAERFSTSLFRHRGFEICCEDAQRLAPQTAIWGPYQPLKAGLYRFECLIEPIGDAFEAPFDIVVNSGQDVLTAGVLKVSRNRPAEILLEVDRPHESFEFRILARKGYDLLPFRFFGLRYARTNSMRGPHQSEAMALLAHLVALRLRHPYLVETL